MLEVASAGNGTVLAPAGPPIGGDAQSKEVHSHGLTEIELSALSRQCLDRRLPDQEALTKEVAAWEERRTSTVSSISWRFTTADARIKLKHLYPSVDD